MKINLVTSNKGKLKELKKYLEPEIEVEHIDMEYILRRKSSHNHS